MFVAGFVGSPPMNLWRQVGEDRREVVVGIRPEAVHLDRSGVPATVDWVEDLGHEHLIGCTTDDGNECCTRWQGEGRPPEPGSRVHLRIDQRRMHRFDADTGERLR